MAESKEQQWGGGGGGGVIKACVYACQCLEPLMGIHPSEINPPNTSCWRAEHPLLFFFFLNEVTDDGGEDAF